jgi:hypothetical protein
MRFILFGALLAAVHASATVAEKTLVVIVNGTNYRFRVR